MNRYAQLNHIIDAVKPVLLVEVGTNAGDRAELMIRAAAKHSENVDYIGFDLFEEIDDATSAAELNAKRKVMIEDVSARLHSLGTEIAQDGKHNVDIHLFMGNTRETLPAHVELLKNRINRAGNKALVFLDGGHSIDTIKSDLFHLQQAGFQVIVCDDWYEPDKEGKIVDIKKWGCNNPLRESGKDICLLPITDPVREGGVVHMAVIGWRPARVNLEVKTRNCVPDQFIQDNVRNALNLGLRTFPFCKAHNKRAILVSGGPSLYSYLPRIKKMQEQGGLVVAVKHAHDMLIEHGIIPWACVLLDPRGHVSQFIENPHPRVHYFVSSTCHPTTFEKLMAKHARIWLYHAAVGAGEHSVIGKGLAVAGGPSAGTRALTLLFFLGFRWYDMVAFDSSTPVKPDMAEINPATGGPKWIELQVNDRYFWTTHELLADVQFMEKAVWPQMTGCTFDVHGDGMMAHVFNAKRVRIAQTDFEDLFAGYDERPAAGTPVSTSTVTPAGVPAGADQPGTPQHRVAAE